MALFPPHCDPRRQADAGSALANGASGKAESHDEEEESHDLEPQLVSGAPYGAARGADAAHDRVKRAVAPSLASRDLGHDPQLSEGRNFTHGLDFNSLRRYNDATRRAATGEPIPQLLHLKIVG